MAPVTIVIPARNEAQRLPALLGPLTEGLPEVAQVVVVDDHSTDGTGEVAGRYPGVRVLPSRTFPQGGRGRRGPATRGRKPPRRGTSCSWTRTSSSAPKLSRGPWQCAGRGAAWSSRLALPPRGAPLRALERPLQRDDVHGHWCRQRASPANLREAAGPMIVTATFRQMGSFGWADAVLYPVHLLFFTFVFLLGIFRVRISRRVHWRGRSVRMADAAGPPP